MAGTCAAFAPCQNYNHKKTDLKQMIKKNIRKQVIIALVVIWEDSGLAQSQFKYDAMRDPNGLHDLHDLHGHVRDLRRVHALL